MRTTGRHRGVPLNGQIPWFGCHDYIGDRDAAMRTGIQTERELKATREKLRLLEEHCEKAQRSGDGDSRVQEVTLWSLKRFINQLVEEIVRCEAHLRGRDDSENLLAKRFPVVGAPKEYRPMIHELDDNGNLPPGIHRASLSEIEERFGRSTEIRRAQMQSLYWIADLAKRAGVERLIVNGSFVTDVFEPNDVDCVVLPGPVFPRDRRAARGNDGRSALYPPATCASTAFRLPSEHLLRHG